MELTPENIRDQWGSPLRKVEFDSLPELPDESTAFFKLAGLPEAVTVGCFRSRFVTTSHRLDQVWQQEMDPRVAMPQEWDRFWHLGEVEYIQSQAWSCIEEVTGRVVSIDVEIDDPVSPINSSILHFMSCLKTIRDWSQETGGSMEELAELMGALETEVKDNDAEEYWLPYLEYEQDSEEEFLDITVA